MQCHSVCHKSHMKQTGEQSVSNTWKVDHTMNKYYTNFFMVATIKSQDFFLQCCLIQLLHMLHLSIHFIFHQFLGKTIKYTIHKNQHINFMLQGTVLAYWPVQLYENTIGITHLCFQLQHQYKPKFASLHCIVMYIYNVKL